MKSELLSTDQMYRADKAAIEGGTPGIELMENAGRGLADSVTRRWARCRVLVLCGPGNNGGDGYIAARLLEERGWPVTLAALGDPGKLSGDAKTAYERWGGTARGLDPALAGEAELVIDALFGAGLSRPLDGKPAEMAEAVNERGLPCVAVDMPSGVHGDTGQVLGTAFRADLTVTFARRKPGHVLLPGREWCGTVVLHDIGIGDDAIAEAKPDCRENGPELWAEAFPWPQPSMHKYDRGFVSVLSGGRESTGAARLGAYAALRSGAGLVTLLGPPDAIDVLAAHATAVMTASIADEGALRRFLEDERRSTALIGPGNGVDSTTLNAVLLALELNKDCVLDADALSVFADSPPVLFKALNDRCVLTPHWGEFTRLFPEIAKEAQDTAAGFDKVGAARKAAEKAGCPVLLKGADTVIAAPDGRVRINGNAPPDLATAGAGDVLGGMAAGLLAGGMAAFDAASAAAWLHGDAAAAFGPGLIAEDLIDGIPEALDHLKSRSGMA